LSLRWKTLVCRSWAAGVRQIGGDFARLVPGDCARIGNFSWKPTKFDLPTGAARWRTAHMMINELASDRNTPM